MLMVIGKDDKILFQENYTFKTLDSHYFFIHSSLDNIDEKKNKTNKLQGKKVLEEYR